MNIHISSSGRGMVNVEIHSHIFLKADSMSVIQRTLEEPV